MPKEVDGILVKYIRGYGLVENDKILVEKLIKKDKETFNKFIEIYSTDILKTISYVLNRPEEKEYIEECFDDVVVKIFSSCETFKFNSSFRIWIIKIAKNKAIDYKRKLKKFHLETEIDDKLKSEFNIEEKYMNNELKNQIFDVMNQMKDDDKKLLIDKYVLDCSTENLCKNYFISETALYKRLSRVREKFKKIWNKEHKGDGIS